MVNMPDSTTLTPDATGQINCPAQYIFALMGAGWQIQVLRHHARSINARGVAPPSRLREGRACG
jgi:DNA-binding HxlR family transcriptional regulator